MVSSANALLKKRDYDGALAVLNKALELDPDNATVLNSRGLVYFNKGDEDRAMADYDLALQKRPNFPAPYQQSRPDLSCATANCSAPTTNSTSRCRSTAGNNRYINLLNLGRVQTLRKQYESALAFFAEGKPLDPDAWQIPDYRCITYTEMGRLDEALADCNEVLAQHPKFSGTLARRGNVYRVKGDLDAALKDYNDALKLSPNFVFAYVGRAQVYEARKDMVAARADYRSAGAALTKVDDYETTLARALCQGAAGGAGRGRSDAAQPVDRRRSRRLPES